jgi:hypothetical protein
LAKFLIDSNPERTAQTNYFLMASSATIGFCIPRAMPNSSFSTDNHLRYQPIASGLHIQSSKEPNPRFSREKWYTKFT